MPLHSLFATALRTTQNKLTVTNDMHADCSIEGVILAN